MRDEGRIRSGSRGGTMSEDSNSISETLFFLTECMGVMLKAERERKMKGSFEFY